MRYTGGLLGGSWLTALMGDLGNGKFDGAWLVTNFENLNPANTYWSKLHNLYAKIDTEAPRFLEFEQWWGGHVLLNSGEMQYIVDQLFVGSKLASGQLQDSNGSRIDLRNIASPIIVFCSKADNITPPPQALGWILDLYSGVDEIRAYGQTIVYAVHDSIGHLGIFVSGSVAKKEHGEFASNIDLIDALPPGLYEAVITPKAPDDAGGEYISGEYLVRFEARTLDHIRALGANSEADDREFAAVARVSEINLGLYRTFVQPWVRLWANDAFADTMRRMHPIRLQYEMFSTANPFLTASLSWLQPVRDNRRAVSKDNTLWQMQERFSESMVAYLDSYRDVRDRMSEAMFHSIYGSPLLQALVGLKASDEGLRSGPGKDVAHAAAVDRRISELKAGISNGGPQEAALRALIYVRMPERSIDERSFNLLRRMREEAGRGLSLAEFKSMLRDQFFMLLLDERRALDAIPAMLAKDPDLADRMKVALRRVIQVVGDGSDQSKARMEEIERMFAKVEREQADRESEARSFESSETDRVRPVRPSQVVRSAKHS
jgi:hypothetical protein